MLSKTHVTPKLINEIESTVPASMAEILEIKRIQVPKVNGLTLDAISISTKDSFMAPTIYIDELYDGYRGGLTVSRIARDVMGIYNRALFTRGREEFLDMSFEKTKDRFYVRLVDDKNNQKLLNEVPSRRATAGLSLICEVRNSDGECGMWSTIVTNDLAKSENYDIDRMFELAFENGMKNDPPHMRYIAGSDEEIPDLEDMMDPEVEEDGIHRPIFILSSRSHMLGAAVLFYPGIAERVAERTGDNYYVIPCSRHELAIIPEYLSPVTSVLKDIVAEVNRGLMDPKEFLTDIILFYDMDKKEFASVTECEGN